MENDKKVPHQQQPGTGNTENEGKFRNVQFNELSEVDLEARMNVADQIGVPINNLGDAAALGTMRDRENDAEVPNDRTEEQNTMGETDQ